MVMGPMSYLSISTLQLLSYYVWMSYNYVLIMIVYFIPVSVQ